MDRYRICCFRLLSPSSSSPLSTAWDPGQKKHVADIEAGTIRATKFAGSLQQLDDALNLHWIYWTPPLGDCKGTQNTQCRWPRCWGSLLLLGKCLGITLRMFIQYLAMKDDPMALPELPMSICSSRSLPQERVWHSDIVSLVVWELARLFVSNLEINGSTAACSTVFLHVLAYSTPGLRGLSWSRRWPTKAFATTWSTKRWKTYCKMQGCRRQLWLLQIKWTLQVFKRNRQQTYTNKNYKHIYIT